MAKQIIHSYEVDSWKGGDGTRYRSTMDVYSDGSTVAKTHSTQPYIMMRELPYQRSTVMTTMNDPTGKPIKRTGRTTDTYTYVQGVEAEVREHGTIERVWTTTSHSTGGGSSTMRERKIPEGQTIRTRREVAHDIAGIKMSEEQQEAETRKKLAVIQRRQRELDMLGLEQEPVNKMLSGAI